MNKAEKLQELKEKMEKDNSLPLKSPDTNLVFGVGNADAKILFIGEGPGYWENMKMEPFVGNAGKLLDQVLRGISIPRESVYITNVVHHRPPENRDPAVEEITAYGRYLDEIIKIIDPRLIITLGRFSMGKFLPGVYISSVHGKVHRVNWNGHNFVVVPMYHPAAALRNGNVMFLFKEDFKKVPEILKEIENTKDSPDKPPEGQEEAEQMTLV
jgi:uracil-DNA glycosylase family 4